MNGRLRLKECNYGACLRTGKDIEKLMTRCLVAKPDEVKVGNVDSAGMKGRANCETVPVDNEKSKNSGGFWVTVFCCEKERADEVVQYLSSVAEIKTMVEGLGNYIYVDFMEEQGMNKVVQMRVITISGRLTVVVEKGRFNEKRRNVDETGRLYRADTYDVLQDRRTFWEIVSQSFWNFWGHESDFSQGPKSV